MSLNIKLYKPGTGGSGGSEGNQYISLEVTRWQIDYMRDENFAISTPYQTTSKPGTYRYDRGFLKTLITLTGKISAVGVITAETRLKYLDNAMLSWWQLGSDYTPGAGYLVGLEARDMFRCAIVSFTPTADYPEMANGEQVFSFIMRLLEQKVS